MTRTVRRSWSSRHHGPWARSLIPGVLVRTVETHFHTLDPYDRGCTTTRQRRWVGLDVWQHFNERLRSQSVHPSAPYAMRHGRRRTDLGATTLQAVFYGLALALIVLWLSFTFGGAQ